MYFSNQLVVQQKYLTRQEDGISNGQLIVKSPSFRID